MQNAVEIRHHIRAVTQTRKITNAMQLVATSRMKRVMRHIEYNHRYFRRVQQTMKDILQSDHPITHPYLCQRESGRKLFIVLAGDKGMAGAYNANLLRFAHEQYRACASRPQLLTVGIIASMYFRKQGVVPDIEVMGASQDPSMHRARELTFELFDYYDQNLTDEVYIIFTAFYDEQKNKPAMRRLLPIRISDYEHVKAEQKEQEILYTPSPQEVFNLLIPQYTVGILFGALVQAYASEHFARMNAMRNATQNADKMIKALKQQYNMARQAAITQEITEIAGAAELLLTGDGEYV
ncbi:MAG: ATP synthase F1 subunit gamma [Christensenellales bacterium]|jgi:F-type H+-transporting ATPase subunit gamma